jgi:hypothetical protein
MKKKLVLFVLTAFGMMSVLLSLPVRLAHAQTVFQAAGPTAESIQATVELFRAALGGDDNRNLGPQPSGHREINWDGGGQQTRRRPVTPFDVPQHPGARFTTPGRAFRRRPVGGAQGGRPTSSTIQSTRTSSRPSTLRACSRRWAVGSSRAPSFCPAPVEGRQRR